MWNAWNAAREALPGTCQVCGGWPAEPVCAACVARLAPVRDRCPHCAVVVSRPGATCGACLTLPHRSILARCTAAVDYDYPWDDLVARLKFRGEPAWAHPMAGLMLRSDTTRSLVRQSGAVVPVPVSPERLASRGYNQAWSLAKALLAQAQARTPAWPTALLRLGDAPDQHELPREQRLRNRQGAYMAHPATLDALRGQHVLLVDDVSTTGATLRAAADALRQAGASSVSACVFARTPP